MAEAPSDPAPTEAPAPEAPTPDKKKPEAAAPEAAATEAPAATPATPPAAEPSATTPAEAPTATPTPSPAPVSHPRKPPQRPLRPQPPAQTTVPGPTNELRADSPPPWKPGEGPEGDTVPKAAPSEAPKATPPVPAPAAPVPAPTPAPADAPAAKPDSKSPSTVERVEAEFQKAFGDAEKAGKLDKMLRLTRRAQDAVAADQTLVDKWKAKENEVKEAMKNKAELEKAAKEKADAEAAKAKAAKAPAKQTPPKKNSTSKSKPQKPASATKRSAPAPKKPDDIEEPLRGTGYGKMNSGVARTDESIPEDIAAAIRSSFELGRKNVLAPSMIRKALQKAVDSTNKVAETVWTLTSNGSWSVTEDSSARLGAYIVTRQRCLTQEVRKTLCEVAGMGAQERMIELVDNVELVVAGVRNARPLNETVVTYTETPVGGKQVEKELLVDGKPLTMSESDLGRARKRLDELNELAGKWGSAKTKPQLDKRDAERVERVRITEAISQIEDSRKMAAMQLRLTDDIDTPEGKEYRILVDATTKLQSKVYLGVGALAPALGEGLEGVAGAVAPIVAAMKEDNADELKPLVRSIQSLRALSTEAQAALDKKLNESQGFLASMRYQFRMLARTVQDLQVLSSLPSLADEIGAYAPTAANDQITGMTGFGKVLRGPATQARPIARVVPPQSTATPVKRTA